MTWPLVLGLIPWVITTHTHTHTLNDWLMCCHTRPTTTIETPANACTVVLLDSIKQSTESAQHYVLCYSSF